METVVKNKKEMVLQNIREYLSKQCPAIPGVYYPLKDKKHETWWSIFKVGKYYVATGMYYGGGGRVIIFKNDKVKDYKDYTVEWVETGYKEGYALASIHFKNGKVYKAKPRFLERVFYDWNSVESK